MIRAARSISGEAGYITPAFIAMVGLTMTLLSVFANALVVHYATGVLQSAAEEGARQAVAARSEAICVARIDAAIGAGLGGMADSVSEVGCSLGPGGAVARVTAAFTPWVPGLPERRVEVSGHVRAEVAE
ncbi:hypothetical protein [Euzebya tangerina]|uniref:hypothetical protein n=1 Tax=Euzebya tangerina TaxID=591198 RepID=UPI000E316A72|nr:hypothetical protein [Euzebya tangerina]